MSGALRAGVLLAALAPSDLSVWHQAQVGLEGGFLFGPSPVDGVVKGWQHQPSGSGVQDHLESALAAFADGPVATIAAGRTDAGVHARAQVVHFDTDTVRDDHAWVRGPNAGLPGALRVVWARRVPADFHALLELPGIGRYTAGAICSIAFNQPTPILDGNVMRVLARVFGVSGNVRHAVVRVRLYGLAEDLVRRAARAKGARPCSQFNQALMELAAQTLTMLGGRWTLPGHDYRGFAGDRHWLLRAESTWPTYRPYVGFRLIGAVGATYLGTRSLPADWIVGDSDGLRGSLGAGLSFGWDAARIDLAHGVGGGGWEALFSVARQFRDWL